MTILFFIQFMMIASLLRKIIWKKIFLRGLDKSLYMFLGTTPKAELYYGQKVALLVTSSIWHDKLGHAS